MSYSLNRVTIIGNLGSDPELRKTTSGTRVANLSVATSRSWKDDAGDEQERTEWHQVVCWGTVAQIASRLRKGDRVLVEGRLQTRNWKDREGRERKTTEINAKVILPIRILEKSQREKTREAATATTGGEDLYSPDRLESDDDLPF